LIQLRDPKVTHRLGGVDFEDSYIYDTVNRPALQVVEDHSDFGVRDLHGSITIENTAGARADLGHGPTDTNFVVNTAKH
jgi:hypothetical protein